MRIKLTLGGVSSAGIGIGCKNGDRAQVIKTFGMDKFILFKKDFPEFDTYIISFVDKEPARFTKVNSGC
jgi:hypothetical protein